jgi:hypothetical protein
LQGKAIFDLFDVDVSSTGFPTAHARILDYVQQRYLERVRAQNIRNFGTILAKSLLKGVPPQWEPQRNKIVSTLVAVRDRMATLWPDVASAIVRLIDNLEPENRPRAIAFIAAFPDFWHLLQEATRTVLRETIDHVDPQTLTDYRMLAGVNVPYFRESLLAVISVLDRTGLAKAIAAYPLTDLWPRAVNLYESSGSFRRSEANFRDLIAPFAGRLGSEQHDQLLDAVIENGENWDAAGTPSLLLGLLRDAAPSARPKHDARNRFFQRLRGVRRLGHYEDVLTLFREDGWGFPPPQPDDEE